MNVNSQSDSTKQSVLWIGRLAQRFFQDKRLFFLIISLVVVAGASSLMMLPRIEDPILTPRAATLTTLFPGAEAERVEALVTEKIEEKLREIPEIKRLRSQSRAGISFISIELLDELYDTPPVWFRIRGKIEDSIALLPAEASRPEFDELDVTAYAWIGAIVWDGADEPLLGMMRRLGRELRDDLLAVTGSKEVDLFGDPDEEIIIELDAEKIAAAGLSASEIAARLQAADVKSAVGILRSRSSDLLVQFGNEFSSLEDILAVEVQTDDQARTLRLSEIATVRRTVKDPPDAKAIIDGRPAVVVAAKLRSEYRIDRWNADAQKTIENFADRLPPGMRLQTVMEQATYVDVRIRNLAFNLLLGVSAVAVVTFLFLGWRSSLLVTATLPLASFVVLFGMRMLDIPIHQMSVTGLIIAMGMLIDNAIIASDEMTLSLRRGLSRAAAVGDMVSRLFVPLLASTITTALSFAPIALMEGPAGEFVGSIAITVIMAIFSSLILSMTILPAAAAWLNREFSANEEWHFWSALNRHGLTIPSVTNWYRGLIRGMLRRPAIGIAIGCVLPVAGFIAASQLQEQFFPPADRDQFYIECELRPDASIAETERIVGQIDEELKAFHRIRHTSWFVGESVPTFYYNVITRRRGNPNYAQAIVTLDNNRDSMDLIRELQVHLDEEFPGTQVLVRQLEQGPPFDAPVEARLFGPNLEVLREYGDRLRAIAMEVPQVIHVRTELNSTRPVAKVHVDATQASWAGLREADVANQLFARLEGLPAGSIIEQIEQVPIRVRVSAEDRESLEDLSDSVLHAPLASNQESSSGPVAVSDVLPLSSIATVDLEPQPSVITRYNGRRVNEVQGFLVAGTLPSKALHEFEQRLDASGVRLPPGYSLEYGGEASERNTAVGRLMANVSILVVGMVISLVMALGSFRKAGLIGLVAVLSVGLGMGSLWTLGYPFGFMAIIGTMGLIGIAINDSIVVVSAIGAHLKQASSTIDDITDTVVECTRHVLATSATTVVGFLPLLIAGGSFWPPLAVTISVGVSGATLIALTLVPSVMVLISPEPLAGSVPVSA
jgi:multidrug efflux pump subunit AcrB